MLVVIGRTFKLKLKTCGSCPLGVGQGRSALWRPLGDGRSGVQFQKAINQLTPSPDTPNVSDRNSNPTAPLARVKCSGVSEIGRVHARHKNCGNRRAPPRGLLRVPLGKLVLLQFGELDQEAQRGSTRFAVSK